MFLKFQAFFGPGCQGPRGQKKKHRLSVFKPKFGMNIPKHPKKITCPHVVPLVLKLFAQNKIVCTKNGLTNMFRTQFAMCSPPGIQVKLRETSPRKTEKPCFENGDWPERYPMQLDHMVAIWIHLGSLSLCFFLPLVQEKN